MLASGSYDSTCRVWDTANGALLGTLEMVWDTANGALLGTLEMCSIVNSVAMGPDFLNTVLRGLLGPRI
ncbi:hypothetical protein T484DRAFT_1792424 [Baffinella frigidus]|nr:hypothetical protein T484DRAFT_1792424 [Cryptophyta sp. CCMP2293]